MIINIIYYLNQFSFMSKIEHKNMYKRNSNNIFIRSWIKRNRSNKIIPESILTTNKKTKCENEIETETNIENKNTTKQVVPIDNVDYNNSKSKKTHIKWFCCNDNNEIYTTCCSRQHFYGICNCHHKT